MLEVIFTECFKSESRYIIEIATADIKKEKTIQNKKETKIQKKPEKIAVLMTDRIGDTLNTIYFIENLRKRFPNSKIIYLIKKFSEDRFFKKFFKGKVDDIYEIKYFGLNNSYLNEQELEDLLNENKFDILFDLNPFTDPIARKIKCQISVGFKIYDSTPFGSKDPIKHDIEFEMDPNSPKILTNLKLLSPFLSEFDLSYDLPDFKEEGIFGEIKGKIICLCFEATSLERTMQTEEANKIIKALSSEFPEHMMIILGANINRHGVQIENSKNIINLTGKTTLIDAASLIQKSDFVLSVDTGIMHLSSYLKKPTIGLFFGSDPIFNCPQGLGKNIVIHSYGISKDGIFYDEKCRKNISDRHILLVTNLIRKEIQKNDSQ